METTVWYCTSIPSVPLVQDDVLSLLAPLKNLYAVDQVQNVKDFDQYGLEDPSVTLQFDFTDGTTVTLALGDYNSVIYRYYVCFVGDTNVYTIEDDIVDSFMITVDSLTDTL